MLTMIFKRYDKNFRKDSLHDNFNGKNFEHVDYIFVQIDLLLHYLVNYKVAQCTPSKLNERFVENKNHTL